VADLSASLLLGDGAVGARGAAAEVLGTAITVIREASWLRLFSFLVSPQSCPLVQLAFAPPPRLRHLGEPGKLVPGSWSGRRAGPKLMMMMRMMHETFQSWAESCSSSLLVGPIVGIGHGLGQDKAPRSSYCARGGGVGAGRVGGLTPWTFLDWFKPSTCFIDWRPMTH
jgi:hypothetical protein